MSNQNAECKSCGNNWELRKPAEEIEVLRCSNCDETGDTIQLGGFTSDQPDENELSLVERIELEERHTDLRKRADQVAEHIEQLGGSDGVPDDLESSHRRLAGVSEELSDESLLSSSELDEVSEYIDEIENEIQDLDIVDEISDLEQRVRELNEEIEELEAEKRKIKKFIAHGESAVPSGE
jgi:uncharacterized protein YhaN